jgi:hypothetical protein
VERNTTQGVWCVSMHSKEYHRMKLKISLDRAGFATVFRTTAALLIGNSIVIPVLTDGKAHLWWILLAAGLALMIGANMKIERGPK